MYYHNTTERKYTSSPVYKIDIDSDGKETKTMIFVSTLPKKEGDEISKLLIKQL